MADETETKAAEIIGRMIAEKKAPEEIAKAVLDSAKVRADRVLENYDWKRDV